MKYTGIGFLLAASLLVGCQSNQDGSNSCLNGQANFKKGSPAEFTATFVSTAGDRVFFELNSSSLSHEAQATLIRQVEWMLQSKKSRILIEGRCDERGTREFNLGLGERRGNAVKNFLIAHGVPAESITVVSYGKDKPIEVSADAAKEEFWRQNRVSITVIE